MLLRGAIRSLRRSPGFAAVAVAFLALGLGANVALFSIFSALLLRPLPFFEADRLVDLSENNPVELCRGCGVGTSFPTYREWRERSTSFSELAGYQETSFTLSGPGDPVRLSGAYFTGEMFGVLGATALRGRLLSPADDRAGSPPVAVLGERLWARRFGADPAVIGKSVRIDGQTTVIVGVAAGRMGFPEFAELWIPVAGRFDAQARDDRSFGVVARLRPGVSAAAAAAEMAGLGRRTAEDHPSTHQGWTATVGPLERSLADSGAETGFTIGLGLAGVVLLIACANLANLMLARGTGRRREVAVRISLGASRGQVMRLFLVESLVLASLGVVAGLVVAAWAIQAVVTLIGTRIPSWIDLSFDWRVYGFATLLALAATVLVGLAPALEAGRTDVQDTLKSGGSAAGSGRRENRLQGALAAAQVALAMVLLAATGLLVNSYRKAQRTTDLGYDPKGVLIADVALNGSRYDQPSQVRVFAADLVERLEAIPGVAAAALDRSEFLGTFVGHRSRVSLEGAAEPVPDQVVPRFARAITPAHLAINRIPIVAGRGIGSEDRAGTPLVALVNRAAAERLWPAGQPLGKRFRIADQPAGDWYTVVGVVGDVIGSPIARTPAPFIYTAFDQNPGRPFSAQIRATGDAAGLGLAVRTVVATIDRDQPVDVRTMEEHLATWVAPQRVMAGVVATLGLLALGLAAFGLYAVLAYLVARRTRELGVRMALGAAPADLVRLVLGRGGRLVLTAFVIGIPAAVAANRLIQSRLFGVSPGDPLGFTAMAALLAAVAFLASYLPARRATRVNPVDALRAD
jgi:predicted permease